MNDTNDDALTFPINIMLNIERMIISKLMFQYYE